MVMELEQNVILTKIEEYLDTRKWSLYRLAKEAEIQYSSIHRMYEKNKLIPPLGIRKEEHRKYK